jgi:hypothetical protein
MDTRPVPTHTGAAHRQEAARSDGGSESEQADGRDEDSFVGTAGLRRSARRRAGALLRACALAITASAGAEARAAADDAEALQPRMPLCLGSARAGVATHTAAPEAAVMRLRRLLDAADAWVLAVSARPGPAQTSPRSAQQPAARLPLDDVRRSANRQPAQREPRSVHAYTLRPTAWLTPSARRLARLTVPRLRSAQASGPPRTADADRHGRATAQ